MCNLLYPTIFYSLYNLNKSRFYTVCHIKTFCIFCPHVTYNKIVRLCPSVEYVIKNKKWRPIPKIHIKIGVKWGLNPKITPFSILKWGLTTKYRNNSHFQTIHHTRTQQCLSLTHKYPKMSVIHKQLFSVLNWHKINTQLITHKSK